MVHRKDQVKPNMESKMHESGLYFSKSNDKKVVLINTVSGNKQGFTKRKVNVTDIAEAFYSKLGYPSVKEFRWIVKIKKIIDCPGTVQDINIYHSIWGKNIEDLKGNSTSNKSIHTTGHLVKVTR